MRLAVLVPSYAIVLALGGCAEVAPWQRAKLAHPSMTEQQESAGRAHVQALHEGASGGAQSPASGCGCN